MIEQAEYKPLRIAIVGATRGVGLVQRCWLPNGVGNPVALCDLKLELAREKAAELESHGADDVRVFTDIDEMLDWGRFDAVVVASGDATHHALGMKVFEAGFHGFIEKPMTTGVAEARALVERWRESGKVGMVGHEFRYAAAVVQAKQKIEEGVIGIPRLAITMDACGRMGSYWRRRRWRTSHKPTGNSLTLQKAIHQLDIQTYLVGQRAFSVFASASQDHFGGMSPSDLKCETCAVADDCMYDARKVQINGIPSPKAVQDGLCVYSGDVDMHDNQVVTIDYEDGARGSYVECFFTPRYQLQHTIIGDRGQLDIRVFHMNPFQQIELSWIGGTHAEQLLCPAKGDHGGGDDALGRVFQKAVCEQSQLPPSLIDGFNAVALACAIDQSARQRQPQQVETLHSDSVTA